MSETQRQPAPATNSTVQQRHKNLMDEVISNTVQRGFDADAWVVMNQRDTRLIEDEIMGGTRSGKFIYEFRIQSTNVSGISAVGARELASYYQGIRHRILSSTRKIKSLFIFTTYDPPTMQTKVLPELADEPDGYSALCEVTDLKTGNTMQAEVFESQFEWSKNNNAWFERPHFGKIAQAKAQRNAILAVIPQAVQIEWMNSMKGMSRETITGSVLDEKRDGVLKFGAAKGLVINREVLETLLLEQIAGLSEAARTKNDGDFLASAMALGLIPMISDQEPTRETTKAAETSNRPAASTRPAPARKNEARPDPRANQPDGPSDLDRREGRMQETSERQPDPPAQQTGPSTQQAPAATTSTPKPFKAWLVDGEGESIPDEAGQHYEYTDPEEFAHAYVNARDSAFPPDREGIVTANHDSLRQAMIASTKVAPIINAGQSPSAPTASQGVASPSLPMDMPVDEAVVPAPTKPIKAEFERFNAEFEKRLALGTTEAWIKRVNEANAATVNTFPPKHRLAGLALVEARQRAISPAPARDAPIGYTPEDLSAKILQDVYATISVPALDTYLKMERVMDGLARLMHEAPAIYTKTLAVIDARREELVTSPTRTHRQIADAMKLRLDECVTMEDIIDEPNKGGLNYDVAYIADANILAREAKELWAEIKAYAVARRAAITTGGLPD